MIGLAILLVILVGWFGTGLLGARMILGHPSSRFASPGELDPALLVATAFGPIGLAAAWTIMHASDA
jgi:hypothetical protein